MIRLAHERISNLVGLAEVEGRRGQLALATSYLGLARRIGTRYNVRLPIEYRELYCRGCSSFWVEGRTVRTRMRSGHRVRSCLVCGRMRRLTFKRHRSPMPPTDVARPRESAGEAIAVGDDGGSRDSPDESDEEEG